MRVVLTGPAVADLQHIEDFVSTVDPARASDLIDALLDSCGTLAEMPMRYAILPRYQGSGIRRRPHGQYLIFFRISGELVEVLRILHGAMDHERIMLLDN